MKLNTKKMNEEIKLTKAELEAVEELLALDRKVRNIKASKKTKKNRSKNKAARKARKRK